MIRTLSLAPVALATAAIAACLAAAPVRAAQLATTTPSLQGATVTETVAAMKPGDFLWAPQVAPEGPVVIVVSIAQQRAFAYRNGLPIGISTVSTGKKGHETPTGVFTLLQKNVDHKSNLYNDAPMPYMQRLTWDGIAMHAGNLPGYPASHGCVRLPMAFAKLLYGVTKLGLTVIVTAGADIPRFAPSPAVLSNTSAKGDEDLFGGSLWQPERSTTGPVSVIISGADKRMLVLRNGVPIGSAPVKIAGSVEGTSAYTLGAIEGETYKWMKLPMPGEGLTGPVAVSPDERARLTVPEDIRIAMAAVVAPGTTVVVTPDTLRSGGAGKKMTVMTGGGMRGR
ncbi:MAG: L,D-transpeptidase [Pseudomonadota bacterium]